MMDRERWRELEPLLDRALELTTAERAAWLARLRADSPELAGQLTSLLSDEARADQAGFLAEPLDVSLAGMRFGAYELERSLGYGGMGHVWLARRADGQFEGRAAVKLLNLPLLSAAGRARFRREGSVLARLTHPGIARLLDAGVAGGHPYLVLEYVEGERIDAFADERRLPLPDRIRLVQQVLSAVAHAHANLVVHRDLKPSNILVTPDGTAKLLDFGIAKLLPAEGDEAGTALTAVAGAGHTPGYAAPEQLRGDAVTTATDVYAVGTLLYQLLTGRPPFDLAGRSAAEVERIVCGSEPVRPSECFAREAHAGDAEARARARAGTPERLRRQLRGDLDAIVLQALRKDPERRYASAGALAEDLQRYLDGRPVLARPERAAYRARKFIGRHRAGVAMAGAAVLVLAGAGLRERALRARAETEARTATAVEQYLESVFRVSDPFVQTSAHARDVTAATLLDRGAARIDAQLAGQPAVSSELRIIFAKIYGEMGMWDRSATMLERALAERKQVYGPRHPAVAQILAALGKARAMQDRVPEAEPLLREALAQRRRFLGERDTATANSLDDLAGLLGMMKGQFAPAESLLRQALAIRRAALGDTAMAVAENLNNLAVIVRLEGKFEESEPLFRQAVAIQSRRLGPNHPSTAITMNNLAAVENALGRYDQAEALYRRTLAIQRATLGDSNPNTTITMANLAMAISRNPRRLPEADSLVRRVLVLDRRTLGADRSLFASDLLDLGELLTKEGRFEEALPALRQALAIQQKARGPRSPQAAGLLDAIGETLWLKGDASAAIPPLRQALTIILGTAGEKHPLAMRSRLYLAAALRDHGNLAEAEQLFRQAISLLTGKTREPQREQLAQAEIGLGRTLLTEGHLAEAQPVAQQGLALARQTSGPAGELTAEGLLGVASCLLAQGKKAEADPLLAQADAILRPLRAAHPAVAAQLDRARAQLDRARAHPVFAAARRPA